MWHRTQDVQFQGHCGGSLPTHPPPSASPQTHTFPMPHQVWAAEGEFKGLAFLSSPPPPPRALPGEGAPGAPGRTAPAALTGAGPASSCRPAALHWNPVCSEWPSPGTKFRGRGCPFGPEDRRPGSGAKEETRRRHRADLGSRPREPRARRSRSSLALAADGQRGGVPAHLRGRGQQPAQPAAAAPHRPG